MHPISQSASTAPPSAPCKPKAAASPTKGGYASPRMTRQISIMPRKRSGPGSSSDHRAFVAHGGIKNDGNNCFVASVLQIISVIPEWKSLFRRSRTDRIQSLGKSILDQVNRGITVSSEKLQNFRNACLEKKLVESEGEQEDAQEFLSKLIHHLGGKNTIQSKVEYELCNLTHETVFESKTKALEYPDSNEPIASVNEETNLEISRDYTSRSIREDMQQMIDRFWKPEEIDLITRKQDGRHRFIKQTYMATRKITPDLEYLPKVLTVSIKTHQTRSQTIPQNIETIYPAGRDALGEGIGPRYRLQAMILHKPGHYFAAIRTLDGDILEVNDSVVKTIQTFERRIGCCYIYTLDTSPTISTLKRQRAL